MKKLMSINVREISGVPCSGKSYYFQDCGNSLIKNSKKPLAKIVSEAKYLLVGLYVLGFNTSFEFFRLSLKEDASIIFRVNIFRNILRKFGLSLHLSKRNFRGYIDEGISHIPFNLLSSNTCSIIEMITPYLSEVNVTYIYCPSPDKIKDRLLNRGHSRLNFLTIEDFMKKNSEVETIILSAYPNICSNFEVFVND